MPDRHASDEAAAAARVAVLLPVPLAGALDYRVPGDMRLAAGDFVAVPLGRRRVAGVVWGPAAGGVPHEKLKAVAERLPAPPMTADLGRRAACGAGVATSLAKAGLLEAVELPARPPPLPDWRHAAPTLSSAQTIAADDLTAKVQRGGYAVTLLDGVTGSGKTEVYFAAVAAALEQGRQALVLLPEIALSTQLL